MTQKPLEALDGSRAVAAPVSPVAASAKPDLADSCGGGRGTARGWESLRACVALGCVALAALAAGLPGHPWGCPGAGAANQAVALDSPAEADDGPSVRFELVGPNDGEPINCRTLRLTVRTSYNEPGNLVIFLNERKLTQRALRKGWHRGDDDLFETSLEIDVLLASRALGEDYFAPDAGPLRVNVQLFSPLGAFVTSYLWTGFVGKPWFEVLPDSENGGIVVERNPAQPILIPGLPPAVIVRKLPPRVLLHPVRKDVFYMLVASLNEESLHSTPEDATFLQGARLVESGGFNVSPEGTLLSTEVSLEPIQRLRWQHAYIVLWTLNEKGEWKRSPVSAVLAE